MLKAMKEAKGSRTRGLAKTKRLIAAREKEPCKKRKPIEADLKEIARELETTVELVRGRDKRWEVSGKRARAVALLVRERQHAVSEVARQRNPDNSIEQIVLDAFSAFRSIVTYDSSMY